MTKTYIELTLYQAHILTHIIKQSYGVGTIIIFILHMRQEHSNIICLRHIFNKSLESRFQTQKSFQFPT